ncbi:MAG: ATPase, partial [Candidatus Alkanophagales archaeon]
LEAELGISIDVEARSIEAEATKEAAGVEIPFSVSETKNYLTLNLEDDVSGRNVEIYIDNEFLFSPVVGKKNRIRVGKNSKIGKELLNTLKHGGQIRILRS